MRVVGAVQVCAPLEGEHPEGAVLTVSLTESSVITSNQEVVWCDLVGGAALLDLRTSTYFSLNSVGAFVWALLRNPIAISEIHEGLVAHYDVEQDKCYTDLMNLLEELTKAGLIIIVDAAPR